MSLGNSSFSPASLFMPLAILQVLSISMALVLHRLMILERDIPFLLFLVSQLSRYLFPSLHGFNLGTMKSEGGISNVFTFPR